MTQKESKIYKYGKLSSVGIEMGMSVVAGYFIGTYLDETFDTGPFWLIFWVIAGFGSAIKAILNALKDWQKQIDEDKAEEAGNKKDLIQQDQKEEKP